MSKRNRRRLKKSVRIVLHRVKMVGVSACISATVTPLITSTAFPVHAESLNQNFAIKTTATLQHKSLSDATTLKEYVVNDYNTKNVETVDLNETKVVATTPTVVVNPTIENITFQVEKKEETEEERKTNSFEENSETLQATATPETKAVPSSDGKKTKDDQVSTEEETIKADTLEVTDVGEKAEKDTKITEAKKESSSSDKATSEANSSVKTETEQKNFQEVISNSTNELGDLSTIIGTDDQDLDELASTAEAKTIDVTKPLLELTNEKVLVTDGSEFVAEDYIKTISGKNGNLPILKIEGDVNTLVDGTYEVKYSAVDTDGSSSTATLQVVVENSEATIKARNEKKKTNIDAFVAETSGKHIDEDGYYGDQCWDLWGYFNRVKDLTDFDDGCSPYGYVYAIPLKYKTSGAKKYYKYIEAGEKLEVGDWLFWNKGSSYSDSHVALLLGSNEDGTLKCLTQSYGQGTRVLDLQPDIMAAFRLKDTYQWWNS